MYIPRRITHPIKASSSLYQVIVITGPRQTGKTTLCRHIFPEFTYYNLEDPTIRAAVESDPRAFIFDSENSIIIDEIQRLPYLFSYIQVCVDSNPERKFVITGSSDFQLMEKITQSLAGRAALFTVLPFSFKELPEYINEVTTDKLLFNGFYPGVITKSVNPTDFYANYYATYIERDLRQIKTVENIEGFRLFVRLLAGRTGTELNLLSLANEVGVSSPTTKKWLGILQTSYITFTLSPYYANLSKRLTKTPKVYFYDTGLLCYLLGITRIEQLEIHPLRGQIFENLAVTELLKERYNTNSHWQLNFYRENGGREVDILKEDGLDISIYEVKSSKTFNKSFVKNLSYLKDIFGERVKKSRVVYDGPSIPPNVINIREL